MKKLLLVLGAALMATARAEVLATSVALREFHTGMTFGFGCPAGYFATPAAKAEVDRMCEDGVRWVCLVVNVWSESFDAPRQYAEATLTPADDELEEIIRYMHLRGLRVQLRPMLECFDGTTRAWIQIREDSTWLGTRYEKRSAWFKGLTERSVRYARLAERTGCELYCIDSELDRMTDCNAEWKDVIKAVRAVYHGPVTSCHTVWVTSPDKIEQHLHDRDHWFHDLDLLSLSVYMGTGGKDRSVGEAGIRYGLQKSSFSPSRLQAWRKAYGKPIIFGEIGCAAQCATSAGGYEANADYVPERQVDYLNAAYSTYLDTGAVNGFYWWQWLDSNTFAKRRAFADPRVGFSIKDKPAEEALKKFYRALNVREQAVSDPCAPGKSGLYAALPDENHAWAVHDHNRRNPTKVEAPEGGVPSDAVVLFDGTAESLAANWCATDGSPTKWKVEDGQLVCVPGSGYIRTKEEFADCQLHIEWFTPTTLKGTGQARGNSGVIFYGKYEIQVLDSWGTDPDKMENPNYADGQAGAFYGQNPPLVNPIRPHGTWQTYDIVFHPPRFDGTTLVDRGSITCFFNGVLVQDAWPIEGETWWRQRASLKAIPPAGPFMLQDHGNPVPYRNVWIRRIPARDADKSCGGPGTTKAAVAAKRAEIAAELYAKIDFAVATADNVNHALEVLSYHDTPAYHAAAEKLLAAWRADTAAQQVAADVKSVAGTLRLLKAFGIGVE